MTAKIEPHVKLLAANIIQKLMPIEDGNEHVFYELCGIIAAHAPKQVKVQELSITVGQIQQAIDYGFTISGLEQELTRLIHAAEQADE